MNFLTFIQNSSRESPEYWQTHTFSTDENGEIIAKERSPNETSEEIVLVFQEGLKTFKEDLKKESFRSSLFNLVTCLPKEVQKKCFRIFQSFIVEEISAFDEKKIPITLYDLHRSRRLQAIFEKPEQEPLELGFSEEEIKAYHSFCQDDLRNISLEDAFKILIVARCLEDTEVINEVIHQVIPSLMENLTDSQFSSIACKFYPDTYLYSRLEGAEKRLKMSFFDFISTYSNETVEFWKTHTLFLAEGVIVVEKGCLAKDSNALDLLKKSIATALEDFKKNPILRDSFLKLANNFPIEVQDRVLDSTIIEAQMSGESIAFSLNDLRRSETLRVQTQGNFKRGNLDLLTFHESEEEWNAYFSFVNSTEESQVSYEEVKKILNLADFLLDYETIQRVFQETLDSEELSDDAFFQIIGDLLQFFKDHEIQNSQKYIANLIQARIKDKRQAEVLSFFEKLSNHLNSEKTISPLKEPDFSENEGTKITSIGISSNDLTHINLSSCEISNALLMFLGKRFPGVLVLDISESRVSSSKASLKELKIPKQWQNNLETLNIKSCRHLKAIKDSQNLQNLHYLNISQTGLTEVPSGLTNLETFIGLNTPRLNDVSALDHLKHLKTIRLSESNIQRVPVGCEALETFVCGYTTKLKEISGLNDCKKLRRLYLDTPSPELKTFPSKCKELVEVSIHGAAGLDDYSGLNDSLKLKRLSLNHANLKQVPIGCKSLVTFSCGSIYSGCSNPLEDISGLDDLKDLKEVDISGSLVSKAPNRCKKLRVFIASNCKNLADISELDNLLFLEEVDVSQTKVKAAPKGCSNIQIFKADWSKNFEDLSPLDYSLKLRTISVRNTPVKNYCRGCRSLISFCAIKCDNLPQSEDLLLRESPLLKTLETPYIEMKKK